MDWRHWLARDEKSWFEFFDWIRTQREGVASRLGTTSVAELPTLKGEAKMLDDLEFHVKMITQEGDDNGAGPAG